MKYNKYMTNQEIKDKIELEFGWLSPDEKQKLYVLVIGVYNSAVDSSAQLAIETRSSLNELKEHSNDNKINIGIVCCADMWDSINALKLKL